MKTAPLILVATASALSACSFGSSLQDERTGVEQQAIVGGRLDNTETPGVADVVVNLTSTDPNATTEPGYCTGTFITPTAILTAGHCLCGGHDGFDVYVGAATAPKPVRKYHASTTSAQAILTCPITGPSEAGADVAILFLDVGPSSGYSTPPALDYPLVHRPTLTSSCAACSPNVGMAGYAGTLSRDVAYAPATELEEQQGHPDPYGQYWSRSEDGIYTNHGDSGGPLFLSRVDANGATFRDVIGVLNGCDGDPDCPDAPAGTDYWTDVTQGYVKSWIQQTMTDTTRTTDWYRRHPGYAWFGEVDYVGGCQQNVDSDCDHWLDWHDDCPDVFNPDQKETVKVGIGDACPPPPPPPTPAIPLCTATQSCGAGWNDTPPELTVSCVAAVDFYTEPPTSSSAVALDANQLAVSMSDYAGFLYACFTGTTTNCWQVSTYSPPSSWCFTTTGSGSSSGGGYTGGKFGCKGTCQ